MGRSTISIGAFGPVSDAVFISFSSWVAAFSYDADCNSLARFDNRHVASSLEDTRMPGRNRAGPRSAGTPAGHPLSPESARYTDCLATNTLRSAAW